MTTIDMMSSNIGDIYRKVTNTQPKNDRKLRHDKQYNLIFDPENIRNLKKLKKENGSPICLRFHSLGFCYSDYKTQKGYEILTDGEAWKLRPFTMEVRSTRESFKLKRNHSTKPANTTPVTQNEGKKQT